MVNVIAKPITVADLKFQPCTQCGGRHTGGMSRSVFHFADRIVTRCKNSECSHVEEFKK